MRKIGKKTSTEEMFLNEMRLQVEVTSSSPHLGTTQEALLLLDKKTERILLMHCYFQVTNMCHPLYYIWLDMVERSDSTRGAYHNTLYPRSLGHLHKLCYGDVHRAHLHRFPVFFICQTKGKWIPFGGLTVAIISLESYFYCLTGIPLNYL